MPASEMKSCTAIIKGEASDLLPSYKEEKTEEFEGVICRKFVGDVNVGGKGVLLIK
jgi:formylmethanofuran dehydrogenase subunit C